jgi:hypothetical protein
MLISLQSSRDVSTTSFGRPIGRLGRLRWFGAGVIEADAFAHPAGSLWDAFGEDAACHEIVGAPVALPNQE